MTFRNLIMSNKDFQALGKVSRVVEVYLLDDQKERIRRLPIGSEEHYKYGKEELEIVVKKALTKREILLDFEECLF
jgi:hypothetical protein